MELNDIREKIAPILRDNGVSQAKIFGSFARGEDKSESDIDLVISLGRPMGMFAYMRLVNQLEGILGRKVDLLTDKSVNTHIAPYIKDDLKIIYEG